MTSYALPSPPIHRSSRFPWNLSFLLFGLSEARYQVQLVCFYYYFLASYLSFSFIHGELETIQFVCQQCHSYLFILVQEFNVRCDDYILKINYGKLRLNIFNDRKISHFIVSKGMWRGDAWPNPFNICTFYTTGSDQNWIDIQWILPNTNTHTNFDT